MGEEGQTQIQVLIVVPRNSERASKILKLNKAGSAGSSQANFSLAHGRVFTTVLGYNLKKRDFLMSFFNQTQNSGRFDAEAPSKPKFFPYFLPISETNNFFFHSYLSIFEPLLTTYRLADTLKLKLCLFLLPLLL